MIDLNILEKGGDYNEFTRELDDAVQPVRRNEKWRLDYMTLQQEYREKYNEGLEAGIEQGLERGIKILYCDIHMTIPEIAAKMSMTEQQVEKIIEKFGEIEEK